MKILMLYRPNSEQAGPAEDYMREYTARHPDHPISAINIDSPEGGQLASSHGVMSFPAVLVLRDDGSFLQLWQD